MITKKQFNNSVTYYTIGTESLTATYYNPDATAEYGQIVTHDFPWWIILEKYRSTKSLIITDKLEKMVSDLYADDTNCSTYLEDLHTEAELTKAFWDAQDCHTPISEGDFLLNWALDKEYRASRPSTVTLA